MEKKPTYCRLCEAGCGFIAEVEDNLITKYYPDRDHPVSKGYCCVKGLEMLNIQYHPKRIKYPLKRKDSSFEKIPWDQAADEIGTRLIKLKNKYGHNAIGGYFGNPIAFSNSMAFYGGAFLKFLDSNNLYSAGSQDCNNKFAHSKLFFGSPTSVLSPDFDSIDYLLALGTNPLASHFSLSVVPKPYHLLKEMEKRGCKIVWVNPRNTESSKKFGEQVFIRPNTDIFFLFGLIHYILDNHLEDKAFIDAYSRGIESLRNTAKEFGSDIDKVGEITGIAPQKIIEIAEELASASKKGSASVYGRVGICRSTFATLVSWAVDILNFITGNVDKKGNFYSPYGRPPTKKITKSPTHSRIGNFAEVLGTFPAAIMADEILTPGDGQIRAMIIMAGDPLVSCPNSRRLEMAFKDLELLVSIDCFINDAGSMADYILPATTFLEREDFAMSTVVYNYIPFINYSAPVVKPLAEEKQEWEIFNLLSGKMGLPTLGNDHLKIAKSLLSQEDLAKFDDLVGSEKGIFLNSEHKVSYNSLLPDRIPFPDKLVPLVPEDYMEELKKLREWRSGVSETYPFLLISGRNIETLNSWIHVKLKTNTCHINIEDASKLKIEEGSLVKISTQIGSIEMHAEITPDLMPGVIWIPHGWGRTIEDPPDIAADKRGVNINLIIDDDWKKIETFAGMVLMDGVPVKLEKVEG